MAKTQGHKSPGPKLALASAALLRHLRGVSAHDLVSTSRVFPLTARVDLQRALEAIFDDQPATLFGLHTQFHHTTLTFAEVLAGAHYPVVLGPLQHDEIDCGGDEPVRCLKQGLWLSASGKVKFACLLSPESQFGRQGGMHLELAVAPGSEGAKFSSAFLTSIEQRIRKTASYRGKVLSLEFHPDFHGTAGTIRVHRLDPVPKEHVILPARTLDLLERNVAGFAQQRKGLQKLGLPVKKGLLFYGPPGTGKTHTIRYLASQLPGHTTFLITAEHIALLDHYFQLARHLQPSIIVLEDVDLIGRSREQMEGPCEESMLNKLLNEMDGLREDAEVLFILTTNRPEQLEAALASRPGRVDQAIEFPLPDEDGRRKLIHLYARGLPVNEKVTANLVKRTAGVSAAFIKELMRRSAQYYLQAARKGELHQSDADLALEEILFSGGSLNRTLLGAGSVESDSNG